MVAGEPKPRKCKNGGACACDGSCYENAKSTSALKIEALPLYGDGKTWYDVTAIPAHELDN